MIASRRSHLAHTAAPTLCTIVLLGMLPRPLHAQDALTILAMAEDTYRQIRTLRAEFSQTLVNPMMGTETTTGVLYLSPPGRFAMRFVNPEGDRIVADGEWLWLHTPSSVPNQVIRQPIPEAGPATPNLFAQFVDRPLERYRATYIGADSVGGFRVENVFLLPRSPDIPFRSAVISLSADGMLRKVALVETSGQRRTLVFESIVVNAPIPEEELIFRVPRGTKIVSP